MAQLGPIILVDDDPDDQQLLAEALQANGVENKIEFFHQCIDAFDYLKNTSEAPFIILCDVNIPRQSGLEFKKQIDSDPELRSKSIPFVFFSTSVDRSAVNIAYKEMTVQGFFQKASSFQELRKTAATIIDYWKLCRHPNS